MPHDPNDTTLDPISPEPQIDFSAADIFAHGLRGSETVILTGCGHMPIMVQLGNVSTALRRFVSGG